MNQINHLTNLLDNFSQALADVPYGVQRVFKTVLELARDEKHTLVYGADYRDGGASLVNQAGSMLSVGGGEGIPSKHFGAVVNAFDRLNSHLFNEGINTTPGVVSPLAAEIMLRHYPELKPMPDSRETEVPRARAYIEPSDEDIANDLANMFATTPPVDIVYSEDLQHVEVNDV